MNTIREISGEARALFRELVEHKRLHEDIMLAYKQLNQIFNSAMEPSVLITEDYDIIQVNENLAKLFSLNQDEVEGKKCYEVFTGKNCMTPNCLLNRIRQGEDRAETETELDLHDGAKITCLETATPLRDPDGGLSIIVNTFKDITNIKRAEERINYLAFHDRLTGLPNRMCFLDRLGLEIAHAKRNKKMLAVFFLNLDGFKTVNDRLGHDKGDQLLAEVAGRILGVTRESDTVARIGGDEFTILLTGLTRYRDAAIFAQRLVAALHKPWPPGGQDFKISASIGITLYPGDGENPLTLIKKADQAMYRAKKESGIYQFYNYYLNGR